jgi:hypothetical protein
MLPEVETHPPNGMYHGMSFHETLFFPLNYDVLEFGENGK